MNIKFFLKSLVLTIILSQVFIILKTNATCLGSVGDGMKDFGEDCDNGIFNGYNIAIDGANCSSSCQICDEVDLNGSCAPDICDPSNTISVGDGGANNPNYANRGVIISYSCNPSNDQLIASVAYSTCPQNSSIGATNSWYGSRTFYLCCPGGSLKNKDGSCDNACTTDCAGTCDTNSTNNATDYNGSAAGCGTPSLTTYACTAGSWVTGVSCGTASADCGSSANSAPNSNLCCADTPLRTCVTPSAACGTAAKVYAATDTAFVGSFCSDNSTPSPASVDFPDVGASRNWSCNGGNFCSASRAEAVVTPTPTYSCTSLIPGSTACPATPAPTADTPYSLVATCTNAAACSTKCTSPKIPSGSDCIDPPSYNLYACDTAGSRSSAIGNCPMPNYNPANTSPGYAPGATVCILSSAAAPSHDTCRDPDPTGSCDIPGIACNIGTKTADNGVTAPGSTRSWLCGAVSCEYTYPSATDGICGSSMAVCLGGSATNINATANTWSCAGSNGGTSASCTLPPPVCTNYCGDNTKQTPNCQGLVEQCDGADGVGVGYCLVSFLDFYF